MAKIILKIFYTIEKNKEYRIIHNFHEIVQITDDPELQTKYEEYKNNVNKKLQDKYKEYGL